MTNPFDQFDVSPSGNPFDKFDEGDFESSQDALKRIRSEIAEERGSQDATFLESMGRGMLDVYQGAMQLGNHIGKFLNENPAASKLLQSNYFTAPIATALKEGYTTGDAEAYDAELAQELALYNKNNPDFSWGRLVGGIATPISLIPGGAATTTGRVALGVVAGGIGAGLQPVEDTENFAGAKAAQVAGGAAFGGVLPMAGRAFKWIFGKEGFFDELTKPLYKKGIQRDIAKFLRETFSENKDKITRAIERSIFQGDDKTVGQILAEATKGTKNDFGGMIVRLEKDLAKESDAIKSIYQTQTFDKTHILGKIAGSEDDLARAVAQRTSNATKNYAKAFEKQISGDTELLEILTNKYGKAAMRTAQDLAEANNINPKENLTEFLHYVKIGLDKQLAKTGDDALANTERSAVGSIKNRLTSWIGKKNPLYEQARAQFQTDSLPINRMQVGKELKDAFIGALDDNKPSTLANAVRNAHRTIKRSTGFDRFKKLDDILEPDEVKQIKKIVHNLSIDKRAGKMARDSASKIKEIGAEVTFSLPRILSRPVVVTNHALKLMGKDKTPEYKRLLNHLVNNPVEFLKAYKQPSTSKSAQIAMEIISEVRQLGTIAGTQTTARETQ